MKPGKSNYGMVKGHEEEILAMAAVGKTHAEIAALFEFKDRFVVKKFLKRRRRRERKIEQGILVPRRGRPLGNVTTCESKDQEIKRLKMENKLLRDFLHAAGRK